METLKENKILATLIGAFVLAILVFVTFSGASLSAASEAEEELTEGKINDLRRLVAKAPTNGEIKALERLREQLAAEVRTCYALVRQRTAALRTTLPGAREVPTSMNEFHSTVEQYTSMLLSMYLDSMHRVPQTGTDFDPGINPFRVDLINWSADVEIAVKRFWVLVDLVAALKTALAEVAELDAQRGVVGRPICHIKRITFRGGGTAQSGGTVLTRTDASGLYGGIPFVIEMIVDFRVWSRFRGHLLDPPARIPPPTESTDTALRTRRGIFYDRLTPEMRTRQITAKIKASLRDDDLWRIYNEMIGESPDRVKEQIPLPDGANEAEERARITSMLETDIRRLKGQGAVAVNLTLSGEALDWSVAALERDPFPAGDPDELDDSEEGDGE